MLPKLNSSNNQKSQSERNFLVECFVREALRLNPPVTRAVRVAEGDDQLSITYDAQTTVEPGGRHVEYLTLDFGQVPNAEYELRLTITDLRGKVTFRDDKIAELRTDLSRARSAKDAAIEAARLVTKALTAHCTLDRLLKKDPKPCES